MIGPLFIGMYFNVVCAHVLDTCILIVLLYVVSFTKFRLAMLDIILYAQLRKHGTISEGWNNVVLKSIVLL